MPDQHKQDHPAPRPSSQDARDLIELLERVFRALDIDHDKVVQQKELDRAVLDDHISVQDAQAVAVMKGNFAKLRALHKEGWFARKNGITLGDLLVFEQLLSVEEDHEDSTEHEKVVELAWRILDRVQYVARSKRVLYADSEQPLRNITPEAIRQGLVGDCYFLAAVASVASTNPEIIRRIIHHNEDGTFIVTFPGAPNEPINVSPPTLVELALYAQATEYGTWPAVLEKAYGQYLSRHGGAQNRIYAENTDAAEQVYEALDLMTGQTGHWEYLPEVDDDSLCQMLTEAFRERRAVAAASYDSDDEDTPDAGIPTAHAYSIIAWDLGQRKITLRNPWGPSRDSEPERSDGVPLDGRADGVFTMNLDRFRRNFVAVYYEDWTPDDRYIDGGKQRPGAIVRFI